MVYAVRSIKRQPLSLLRYYSHRNLLLRLELQLSMGMFACTWACILGVAFGMNLNSSLEEVCEQDGNWDIFYSAG